MTQDIAHLRHDRYDRFPWTRFYEAMADRLLTFRDRRDELMGGIHAIAAEVEVMPGLQDRFADGSSGPLRDICPFTVLALFNRGTGDDKRQKIARELAKFLGVPDDAPDSFAGIPVVSRQRSWFFAFERHRQAHDIDRIWEVFAQAIAFAQADDADPQPSFVAAYDNATQVWGVKWNLTMGLYWVRPWHFPTLDTLSRQYIQKDLDIRIGMHDPKRCCNASDYLEVREALATQFQKTVCPVHSFPELAKFALATEKDALAAEKDTEPNAVDDIKPYTVDDILADGCFLARAQLETILDRLRGKKNLILQGPPGTGKTWLAKRLAFALMGRRDDRKVRAVQFHPNLSYEDFVRGWRPSGEGQLELVDGPFVDMIEAAKNDPGSDYVLVIEEINRGNPAQIFGELLTLLEADKRKPQEALALAFSRPDDASVFVPANLYVIGTMNIADRSLALVDLALRRRFAFIDLEPALGAPWRKWVQEQFGIAPEILGEIERRLQDLNRHIADDPGLGRQFRVGHSFVTPPLGIQIDDARAWFRQVVDTEIGPLLEEYWFGAPEQARQATVRLLAGF